MGISRDQKLLLNANKKGGKIVVPTEYEIEKYRSAVVEEEKQKALSLSPSEWVEYAFFMLDKESNTFKNFSFKDREYWIPIYNSPGKKILCKTGRQVNKSTFIGNKALTYCCLQMGFHVLYVSPSQSQTKEFMNTRIKAPLRESHVLKKWEDKSKIDNTMIKEFLNDSKINFRYAFLTADRIRGLSNVDCLVIDEVQDIIMENIPVIEQTTFAASKKYQLFIYAGTPKTMEHGIETMWSKYSDQREWAIPCYNHSIFTGGKISKEYWNIVVDEKCIGKSGLVCDRCFAPISARDKRAYWVQMNPSVWNDPGVPMPYEGYHLSQLLSCDINWKKMLQDRSSYSKNKFYNEVLGISSDSGSKPISRQDMVDNCDQNPDAESRLSMSPEYLERLKSYIFDGRPIWAGVDWSGGSDKSLTVLTIATYIQMGSVNYFVPFYMKKFTGPEAEPDVQINEIIRLCKEWRVSRVGVDWGGGFFAADRIVRELGAQRVVKYQYSNGKWKLRWEANLGRFMAHRSEVMAAIFAAIKRKNVFKFPRVEDFEDFMQDFLSIYSDYNERTRAILYNHVLTVPDDSFHSFTYCFLASFIDFPRREILAPDQLSSYSEDYQY